MSKTKVIQSRSNPPKKKTPAAETVAIHAQREGGEDHLVGIGNLRVIIVPDEDKWFAQGLEIDYASQGDSVTDVKQQFEEGLAAMIYEHLRIYGNIEKLLRVAPNDVWQILYEKGAVRNRYTHVSSHHVINEVSPYSGFEYLLASELNA